MVYTPWKWETENKSRRSKERKKKEIIFHPSVSEKGLRLEIKENIPFRFFFFELRQNPTKTNY